MALIRIEGPVGVDVTATSTGVPAHPLGTKAVFQDTTYSSLRVFRYARSTALKDYGRLYALDQNYDIDDAVTTTTANTDAPCGACVPHQTTAIPAPTVTYSYGWVQTAGYFPGISALSGLAASAEVYTSATAGAVDDARSAHRLVQTLRMVGTAGNAALQPFFSPDELKIADRPDQWAW